MRDAGLATAAVGLLGVVAPGGEAEAQTATPAAPGWLEDQTPGQGSFEYALPINPYELQGEAAVAAVLDRARQAGANAVAMGVSWPYVQRTREHSLWLDPIDIAVRLAEERGMEVSLNLSGTPDWVHPDLSNTVADPAIRQFYPPVRDATELSLWEEFVGKVARRYGTRVKRYKIWNEPNISSIFFRPYTRAASPAPYAKLLRAGYRGVKAASPGSTVAFGGLSGIDPTWFQAFYDAAKQLPDAASNKFYFDELETHLYTHGTSPYFGRVPANVSQLNLGISRLGDLKALMDRNGDAGKQVHVGEVGYTTQSGGYFPAVHDAIRALYLKQTLAIARAFDYVTGLSWFAFHLVQGASEATTGGTTGWALMDAGLNPNRSFQGHREAAGWNSSLKCYPKIPAGGVISGSWRVEPVYEGGAAPTDAYYYELYIDGEMRQSSSQAPFTLDAATIPGGKRRFALAAYTRSGSVYSAEPLVLDVRNTLPVITNAYPPPGSIISNRAPTIQAYVRDAETNLQRANIARVLLDGQPITYYGYDAATDRLYFTKTLAPAGHSARIEARDGAGQIGAFAWGFNVR